jgi:hypothetical protein
MEEDNGKKTMVDSGNLFLAFINTHEMIQNKPYNPFTRLFVSDNSDMQSELCNSSMNMNDVPHSFPQSYSAIVLEVVVRIKNQF